MFLRGDYGALIDRGSELWLATLNRDAGEAATAPRLMMILLSRGGYERSTRSYG